MKTAMAHNKKFPLLLLLAWCQLSAYSVTHLEFSAKIKNDAGAPLAGIIVSVYKGSQKIDVEGTDKDGKFEINLDYDGNYKIIVEHPLYEVLIIKLDTKIPEKNKKWTYSYATTVTMIKKKKGHEPKYDNNPVMFVSFLTAKDKFGTKTPYEVTYTYVPVKENPAASEQTKSEEKEEAAVKEAPEQTTVTDETALPQEKQEEQGAMSSGHQASLREAKAEEKIPVPTIVSPNKKAKKRAESFVKQDARSTAAKTLLEQMEREKTGSRNKELNDYITKAKSKRTFLEEVAASKRTMKQQAMRIRAD